MKRILFSQRGQALLEHVLLIPAITIIICMIVWFSRIVLTKQQLVMASRYGTDLISYTTMNEDEIRQEITDYLCGKENKGRRLDSNKLKLVIKKELLPDIDSINSIGDAKYLFYMITKPMEHTSFVELSYEFNSPALFSAWDKFIPGNKLPKKLTVSARSEVLAGTGYTSAPLQKEGGE